MRRLRDDIIKQELCAKHNVKLLQISIEVPLDELLDHLKDSIARCGISTQDPGARFPWESVLTGKDAELLNLHALAKERGGKCVSTVYVDQASQMAWECAKGHRWFSSTASVKGQGSWCPTCRNISLGDARRTDLKTITDLCDSIGLKFIERVPNSQPARYRVQCGKLHEWSTDIGRLRAGRSCQICSAREAGKKLRTDIEDLRPLATSRQGVLLSEIYRSSGKKMLWQCEQGHRWQASANSIKRGSWCPGCAGKLKFLFTGDVDAHLKKERHAEEMKS